MEVAARSSSVPIAAAAAGIDGVAGVVVDASLAHPVVISGCVVADGGTVVGLLAVQAAR